MDCCCFCGERRDLEPMPTGEWRCRVMFAGCWDSYVARIDAEDAAGRIRKAA